jgi:uncharacterized protein (DUF952 family)/N-acetylglutamate synthase-like GNAT family acetyltransferase
VTPLLHLATTAEWRAHLTAGAIVPSVAEFVHLSTPDQVHLPANRIFGGRRDLLLLVLDPERIGVDVRFEPGVPGDPAAMRFPHAYGPVPTAAVLAVLAHRPGPDGAFAPPVLPPLDAAGRRRANELSLLRRVATEEVPVTGGVAVRTAPVAVSWQHNQLVVDEPVPADVLVADADRALAGLPHRMALLRGDALAPTAAALAAAGWAVEPLVGMAAAPGGTRPPEVEVVDLDVLRPSALARWRDRFPGLPDDAVRQLVDRSALEAAVVDVRHVVVREAGAVLASCVLRVDGATAEIDAVNVEPEHRRRGLGDALLAGCRALAADAGCDLVTLVADAEDHPRRWYARRGFGETDRAWSASRT